MDPVEKQYRQLDHSAFRLLNKKKHWSELETEGSVAAKTIRLEDFDANEVVAKGVSHRLN
jgi:hypothetical protein